MELSQQLSRYVQKLLRIVGEGNAIVILFVFCFIVHPAFSLFRNYIQARKTGLRIIISPITPYSIQWQLSASLLRSVLQNFHWFRAIDWTCAWRDDDKLHKELGQCFIIVSPGLNVLCTSDPKTTEHVLRKWREFVKSDNVNELLGTFGQNVDTSNGDDWPRHRKLTAPCFTERASSTVWTYAIQQSSDLIDKWLSSPTSTTNNMINDTSTLALNVISAVAFENHQVNEPTKGHTMSLREALVTVLSTSISPALEGIMPWLSLFWLRSLLPVKVRQLLLAMSEFRQYMDETVARERSKPPTPSDAKLNLISTLIKANDADGKTQARLSDTELRGNIFIFTVGGLESTSITLSYALTFLALHPEIQDWVAEEVQDVLKAGNMEYTNVFPRLKRVMAVMYETLRLYGPSPPLPRSSSTPNIPYTLPVSNTIPISSSSATSTSAPSTITLPGATQIMLNSWACHTSALHFPNPKTWDPKRWISTSSSPSNHSSPAEEETLLHPTSASGFYAWGSGPRVCPGMKFSQVEFCGVLGSVLARVRVDLAVDGEGTEAWGKERERVLDVLRDSVAEPLLLHVRRAEELRVRMTER